jgi:hypothetical protein
MINVFQLPIILSQSHVHLVGFVPSKTKLGRGFLSQSDTEE